MFLVIPGARAATGHRARRRQNLDSCTLYFPHLIFIPSRLVISWQSHGTYNSDLRARARQGMICHHPARKPYKTLCFRMFMSSTSPEASHVLASELWIPAPYISRTLYFPHLIFILPTLGFLRIGQIQFPHLIFSRTLYSRTLYSRAACNGLGGGWQGMAWHTGRRGGCL